MRRATATVIAVVALAGCGGDDDAETAKDIDAVVSRLSTETDGAKLCNEVFAESLVTKVWKSTAACVKSSSDLSAGGTPIKGRDHEIDGDDASVKITISLPVEKRKVDIGGTIALTRADGDWKVSDFGVDFLRELVSKASVAGLAAGVVKEGFRDAERVSAEVTTCSDQRLAKLDDATMRRYGYAAIAQTDESALDGLKQEFYSCLESGPASRAALRAKFEEGVIEGAQERGIAKSKADCVVARLKETTSDAIIAKDSVNSIKSGSGLSARLQQRFNAALARCQ